MLWEEKIEGKAFIFTLFDLLFDMWQFVVTGCGTSHGNPPIGRPDFWSDDPRDHRRRSGAQLHGPNGERILIDCGPDLLDQLRNPFKEKIGYGYPERCINRCDAVLLTHAHADHCHGLNDLRHLNRLMDGQVIPIYGYQEHLDDVTGMFGYCFRNGEDAYTYGSPALEARSIEWAKEFLLATSNKTLDVMPIQLSHGLAGSTTAFRLGNLAYCTDVKAISPESRNLLRELDYLIIGMLREKVHPTHGSWSEIERIIDDLQPQQAILTHMGHEVHYADWEQRLPTHVTMAYDGLTVPVSVLTA